MKYFFTILFIGSFYLSSFSQSLRTNDYELYLTSFETNEVSVSKGMYMTNQKQYYYEGEIEVGIIDTNKTVTYRFYFSIWDDVYKEFRAKDMSYNILQPILTYKNENTVLVVKDSKPVEITLDDSSSVEYVILSSMLVWLNNQPSKK